jgi:mannose-6-phosphate isomerase-like protein (cupin superfamily)
MERINLRDKLAQVRAPWVPHVIGELNEQQVKVAKLEGEFVWHQHADEDEMFLVLDGRLALHFRDRVVQLAPGELCIVPRGVEHKPVATGPVEVLLFEPKSTRNTGDADDARRLDADELPRI